MSAEKMFKRLIEGPSPEVFGRVARKRVLRVRDAADTARRTGDVDDIARALKSQAKLSSFVNTAERWTAAKGKDENWLRAARKAAHTPDFWEKHGTKVKVGGAALGVAGGLYAAHRLRKWYKGKPTTQKPTPAQTNQPDKKQRMQDPTQPAGYPFESIRGEKSMQLTERMFSHLVESNDLPSNKNAQDIWKEIKRNQLMRRMEELVKKHKRKGGSAAAGRLAQLGRTTGGKLLQSNTDHCFNSLVEGTPETRRLGRTISKRFAQITDRAKKTGERGDYFHPLMLKQRAQRLADQAKKLKQLSMSESGLLELVRQKRKRGTP